MNYLLRFGIMALGLFLFVGCSPEVPESTEAETKELYNSAEYEAEMMGTMGGDTSGGAAEPAGGDAAPE